MVSIVKILRCFGYRKFLCFFYQPCMDVFRKSITVAFEIQRRFVHKMVTVSRDFCSEDLHYSLS
jgi:hypothetical protein